MLCVGSTRLLGNQHVGMSNAQRSRWGFKLTQQPNASGFVLQWNIDLRIDYGDGRVIRGSSTKMVISQLWNDIFRHAIHD